MSTTSLAPRLEAPDLASLRASAMRARAALEKVKTPLLMISHPTGIELGPAESTFYTATEEVQPNLKNFVLTLHPERGSDVIEQLDGLVRFPRSSLL